jgi:DNA-binding FadR family transcriptional regulator
MNTEDYMLQNLRPERLQDRVKEQIKNFILDSGLKPGDQLPTENDMAQKLGVSKTTLREALKVLANVGILESRHGVGTFVKKFSYEAILENLPYGFQTDVQSLQDVVEIRACLEKHFIIRDIQKFGSQDIKDLRAIYADMQNATLQKNLKEEIDTHSTFHCALYRHSGNTMLIELIGLFASLQRNLAIFNHYVATDPDNFLVQHRDLIEAIEKKDVELVINVMDRHFADVLDWLDKQRANAPREKEEAQR